MLMSDSNFDEILTQAYKRMHRYTCAEASLQAALKLWDMEEPELTWATAGYLGGILSGETTCGLLIGSSIAIGFKCSSGLESIPEDHADARGNAIQAVNELFEEFMEKFGSTACKTLCKVDFSDGDQLGEYIMEKKWKTTCDIFLGYTFKKLVSMREEGKL